MIGKLERNEPVFAPPAGQQQQQQYGGGGGYGGGQGQWGQVPQQNQWGGQQQQYKPTTPGGAQQVWAGHACWGAFAAAAAKTSAPALLPCVILLARLLPCLPGRRLAAAGLWRWRRRQGLAEPGTQHGGWRRRLAGRRRRLVSVHSGRRPRFLHPTAYRVLHGVCGQGFICAQ